MAEAFAAEGMNVVLADVQADAWARTKSSLAELQEWIDAVNRLRLSLSQPLRHDLSLAGLFHDWRKMLQDSRSG